MGGAEKRWMAGGRNHKGRRTLLLPASFLPGAPSNCPNRTLGSKPPLGTGASRHWANASKSRIMIVSALVASLCACSVPKGSNTVDERSTLSPRVVRVGDPVPKGGGVYKLGEPYLADGKWFTPVNDTHYDQVGLASWYGDFFHGRRTANGEVYDMNALSAAHPTLPMPTYATVTNLKNNRTIVVRVNDRGPYHEGRLIDLSRKAAEILGFYGHGTAAVRVRYFAPAPLNGDDSLERSILAKQPWAPRVVKTTQAPKPPSNTLLASAVMNSGPKLVVEKGDFEGRRERNGGSWAVTTQPYMTTTTAFVPNR
jgi:rare lipoprotein A (peptidoglycan hydrolase)